jgi:putative Ca2+/H+ antiporter (TMEM165/GDT1 family)
MWGVFLATAVNHLLAVALGSYLTTLFPMFYIKIAAAAGFILFGLWTLKGDDLSCENYRVKFSHFWTVFIAFFIAETGDKTQLATIALAADFNTFIPVWFGSTIGMVIANALGIAAGALMGRKMPEKTIKWFAAMIFIGFGMLGLYESLPKDYLDLPYIVGAVLILAFLIYIANHINKGKNRLIKT